MERDTPFIDELSTGCKDAGASRRQAPVATDEQEEIILYDDGDDDDEEVPDSEAAAEDVTATPSKVSYRPPLNIYRYLHDSYE